MAIKLPFKTKHYHDIIDMIADEENKKEDAETWLKEHTSEDKYWPYYKFKCARCAENIQLLRSLL